MGGVCLIVEKAGQGPVTNRSAPSTSISLHKSVYFTVLTTSFELYHNSLTY